MKSTDHKRTLSEFGPRLVTLSDGRQGLRGSLTVDASAASETSTRPIIDFIASSETLDRYDEIISATGWRLDNYQRNPVFQNAHQYGDIIFTLGKALTTEVREGKLFQRIEFATEVNPMARIAYGLYKGKFLNAVSVGFIPIRWLNSDGTEHGLRSSLSTGGEVSLSPSEGERAGVRGPLKTSDSPRYRRKFLEQELLEVSAVGIPANPEALQLGLKAGVIEKADLEQLLALLTRCSKPSSESLSQPWSQPLSETSSEALSKPSPDPATNNFCSNPADADSHTSALGVGSYEAQLLQLAMDVKRVLQGE